MLLLEAKKKTSQNCEFLKKKKKKHVLIDILA